MDSASSPAEAASYNHRMVAVNPNSPPGERIVLHGVSWDLYQRIREEVTDRKRMTYDRGTLEIMSPSYEHEHEKKLLARLVETFTFELGIPMRSAGSTTFGRRELEKGLEPDECYYIQHYQAVFRLKRIDLTIHPPPDLAIEADVTSTSISRQPIYAALGVPELWRYDGQRLHVLLLEGQSYRPSETSTALPMLRPAELIPFVRMLNEETDETAILRRFQAWIRERFPRSGG